MRLIASLPIATLGMCLACASERSSALVELSSSGDTTIVMGPGTDFLKTDTANLELIWQDARLGNPSTMARSGNRLFVADYDRIHILSASGGYIRTFGRQGAGPADFGQVAALTAQNGRIVVLDARNRRFAVYDTLGNLFGQK